MPEKTKLIVIVTIGDQEYSLEKEYDDTAEEQPYCQMRWPYMIPGILSDMGQDIVHTIRQDPTGPIVGEVEVRSIPGPLCKKCGGILQYEVENLAWRCLDCDEIHVDKVRLPGFNCAGDVVVY